ncbi:MAG: hypothetical protein JWO77_920 [Ilumatobacteraceae bacterium]|nr:hypothetical protein [Ilumatobacteraceae bacterium]
MTEEPPRPAEPWRPTGPRPAEPIAPTGAPTPNLYGGHGAYGAAPLQPVKPIRRNPLSGCGTMVLIVVVIGGVIAALAFALKPADDEKQDAAPKKRSLTNIYAVESTTTTPPEDRRATLGKVCSQGVPAEKAPAHVRRDAAAYGAIVGAGDTFAPDPFPLVAGATASDEGIGLNRVQLLGCIAAEPNGYYEQCEYFTTEGRVIMQRISETEVDLNIVEAKTGKLVGTEHFVVSQDTSCPASISLPEGKAPTWDMPWGEISDRSQGLLSSYHQR